MKREEKNEESKAGTGNVIQADKAAVKELDVNKLGFRYPNMADDEKIFEKISFKAQPGQMIGITGPVACGKSTLGKVFLCEYPYEGSIKLDGMELSQLTDVERAGMIGYLGHDTELFADTIKNNILLGDDSDEKELLGKVCFDGEVAAMEAGVNGWNRWCKAVRRSGTETGACKNYMSRKTGHDFGRPILST
jgi:ABC-type multidrug transport system fused ATPase/permease subunit